LRAGLTLFFLDDLSEDVLVERQVGHQALELAVLLAEDPQLAQLG
jgi:hypothetical protein